VPTHRHKLDKLACPCHACAGFSPNHKIVKPPKQTLHRPAFHHFPCTHVCMQLSRLLTHPTHTVRVPCSISTWRADFESSKILALNTGMHVRTGRLWLGGEACRARANTSVCHKRQIYVNVDVHTDMIYGKSSKRSRARPRPQSPATRAASLSAASRCNTPATNLDTLAKLPHPTPQPRPRVPA
jgi:hypothetical protein